MTPRTLVFRLPGGYASEALVTILDEGVTLAFRPEHGSWGPPIQSKSDSDDLRGLTPTVRVLLPGEGLEFPTKDSTISICPLCGEDLIARWDHSTKLCRNCGATVRNVLVST